MTYLDEAQAESATLPFSSQATTDILTLLATFDRKGVAPRPR